MAIVIEADDESVMDDVLEKVENFFDELSAGQEKTGLVETDNWSEALEGLPEANLALVSVPGSYAASEIEKGLDNGLNVFSFSDNVSIEDEVRLKKKAHEKGLLLMGPDRW